MHRIEATHLSSADDIRAAFAAAAPGAAFEIRLASGRLASVLLCGACDAAGSATMAPNRARGVRIGAASGKNELDPGKKINELFGIATHKILSGTARSYHAAAALLVDDGEYPANGGTRESRIHRLGKLLRGALKESKNELTNPMTQPSEALTISKMENARLEGETMEPQSKALGAHRLRRHTPRQFVIDLVREELADATYDEIMNPAFFSQAGDCIQTGDTIILVRGDASTLVLGVGAHDPETGGYWVTDLARSVRAIAPTPHRFVPEAA